jgi:solute carrier family 25 carnitine/acylcarnitine transporter 20/29
VLDCARRTFHEEGIRGFFRGGMFRFSSLPSPFPPLRPVVPPFMQLLTLRRALHSVTIPLVTITLVRTASFSIYTRTKSELERKRWLDSTTLGGTAASGFLGGAASGLMLSIGTSAFEFTKIKLRTFPFPFFCILRSRG